MNNFKRSNEQFRWRFILISVALIVGVAGLIWRMIDLNIVDRAFLRSQSNARTIRNVSMPAYRGMIVDRNGKALAISTPVAAAWVNPKLFHPPPQQLKQLASLLNLATDDIKARVHSRDKREFLYLKRGLSPTLTAKIASLHIPGLFFRREYRRYYPQGAVSAQVIGFTNIDDQGQEGLELAYNDWLRGEPGEKKVIKDRLGHVVADIQVSRKPQSGRDLTLSIDYRLQYLAYRDLKAAATKFQARSASVVVIDVHSGEILAMANYPSYDPNLRPRKHDWRYRNRAVTDMFEPGSTIKAFSVANALASHHYTPNSKIDTSPGWLMVAGHKVHDSGYVNNGVLTITDILEKSSNIGITKLTLSLPPASLWQLLHNVGFGQLTGIGFPGESPGKLTHHNVWSPFTLATLSFGYGLAVTDLQLAHAYATLADGGIEHPLTLLKYTKRPVAKQVIPKRIAKEVVNMLGSVITRGGTAPAARIPGYWVAGKTGTVRIVGPHGYLRHHHIGMFVGTAPATNPRLVVAVVMNDPQGRVYYGGLVAAPVFAQIMGGALRVLNIPPDNIKVS